VTVAFAPSQSPAIVKEIVGAITATRQRLLAASVVISSGPILAALSEAIDREISLGGVYDGPQMDQVKRQWIAAHVVPTKSLPGERSPTVSLAKTRFHMIGTNRTNRTISCTTSLLLPMTSR
jgi:hypothetical protein